MPSMAMSVSLRVERPMKSPPFTVTLPGLLARAVLEVVVVVVLEGVRVDPGAPPVVLEPAVEPVAGEAPDDPAVALAPVAGAPVVLELPEPALEPLQPRAKHAAHTASESRRSMA